MLNTTTLHDVHRAEGAKLIDFGGWEMPLHYGSQLDEHHAVRRSAGMFDVSHMLAIDVGGGAAGELLRYALANDVDKLRVPGLALYSCMLNGNGGVVDDLIVYRLDDASYRVIVNAATAQTDLEWLRALAADRRFDATLAPRRDLALIAVQGPSARQRAWQATPEMADATSRLEPFMAGAAATSYGDFYVARTGYTGEDGFEIMLDARAAPALWAALRGAGVKPCGLGARDTLRLEAGMNLYGQDMDETVTPLEAGLAWTVDLQRERAFVGRGALERGPPARMLRGLVLAETGGVLRSHQAVETEAGAGEITSGSFAPTLGTSIALARLPASVQVGGVVGVRVRDRLLRARVVKPPFVRHGRNLVEPQRKESE